MQLTWQQRGLDAYLQHQTQIFMRFQQHHASRIGEAIVIAIFIWIGLLIYDEIVSFVDGFMRGARKETT